MIGDGIVVIVRITLLRLLLNLIIKYFSRLTKI